MIKGKAGHPPKIHFHVPSPSPLSMPCDDEYPPWRRDVMLISLALGQSGTGRVQILPLVKACVLCTALPTVRPSSLPSHISHKPSFILIVDTCTGGLEYGARHLVTTTF